MDEQTAKRQQNEKIGHVVSGLNETEERMAMKVHMIALQHDCSVRLSENFVNIVASNETANVELESIPTQLLDGALFI
jgi:hypothetical protein